MSAARPSCVSYDQRFLFCSKGLPLSQPQETEDPSKVIDMPVVLFVPHPRMNVSKSQISFYQIAKMIYALALVGCSQRPQIQANVI